MSSSIQRARQALLRRANDRRILALARQVRAKAPDEVRGRPVVFFNASTRLGGVSLNAAFATLSAMALQLSGTPVRYFACRRGMSRCTLGVVVNGPDQPPPCRTCVAQAEVLFANAPLHWLDPPDPHAPAQRELQNELEGLSVPEMETFTYPPVTPSLPHPLTSSPIPLGELTLPSLRWTLRVHHLQDDAATRRLFRAFLASAFHVLTEFEAFLATVEARCVVVFNGIAFPEAVARWVALQRGLPVITHEVAHQPLTAFFSHGQVTAYPVDIPPDFDLSPEQNARLDGYLSRRFQGDFSMAGLKFWPEMKGLDAGLREKMDAFEALVPVFSNVIFDTAQVHANVVFEHMFAWLDQVAGIARAHPQALFVLRAHPDELRPGSRKQARETVASWFARSGLDSVENVVFIPPDEYVSSYALIREARFVMVYNSTIGLEAALMGVPVLNGGRARYTQVECVHLPADPDAHRRLAEEFLNTDKVPFPPHFLRNARRFMFYQLWRTPLPFEAFLEPQSTRGYVFLKDFAADDLHPDRSATMKVIADGILQGRPFLMPEGDWEVR